MLKQSKELKKAEKSLKNLKTLRTKLKSSFVKSGRPYIWYTTPMWEEEIGTR